MLLDAVDVSPHFAAEALENAICSWAISGSCRSRMARPRRRTRSMCWSTCHARISSRCSARRAGSWRQAARSSSTATCGRTPESRSDCAPSISWLAFSNASVWWICRTSGLRKSDHRNPLLDIEDLHRVADQAGFRITRIRYYTPLVGGFAENILKRMPEHLMERRAPGGSASRCPASDRASGSRLYGTPRPHLAHEVGYLALREDQERSIFALLERLPAPAADSTTAPR